MNDFTARASGEDPTEGTRNEQQKMDESNVVRRADSQPVVSHFLTTLPPELSALDRISMNFAWSWLPDGAALFRDLEPVLWDLCEQNPRLLLKRIDDLILQQSAADANYVSRLSEFSARFDSYVTERAAPDIKVAYFCAEYGVHNSLPNYSGGLGILAGDHLKSASDLNIPLVAIGLLYRYGYFRQRIAHDGWQEEAYFDVFDNEPALMPVIDNNGERVSVSIHIRGREVHCQVWLARVGRISLYLLDTNVPENSEVDKLITGHLYGGDLETRIVQEKVLGIGGVRLLRKLSISPSVYHLNEGHSAFLTLELAHEYLKENPSASFEKAAEYVRDRCVFTTHTPVAAGNDVFPPEALKACFSSEYVDSLKISRDAFFDLGRTDPKNDLENFGMTPLALRMCRSTNGVSEKHGEVSRNLWKRMEDETKFRRLGDDVELKHDLNPISYVTNGVHPRTWIAPIFQSLYAKKFGPDWNETMSDAVSWADAINSLPDHEIWKTHEILKRLLVSFIRRRLQVSDSGTQDTINEHSDTTELLSPNALTIGFARRVAAYKRWDLIFTDVERLLRLVDDNERTIQFVFAGKAHPQDRTAKEILQHLMSINHDSNWQRRAVFVEDYDQEVARYLVHGVDVWMNVPRRPLEASGTSGMKAAMNGVLNFSILDGWWIEGFNGENGFAIGGLSEVNTSSNGDATDNTEADLVDAESLYSTLEQKIVPLFYSRDESGLPIEWIGMMKNSIATLTPKFSSDRMVREYLERIYLLHNR